MALEFSIISPEQFIPYLQHEVGSFFSLDERLFHKPYTHILLATRNGQYEGSAWIWYEDKYLGAANIRTSMNNKRSGSFGIEESLLDRLAKYAQGRKIAIVNYFPELDSVLSAAGYHKTNQPGQLRTFVEYVDNGPYWTR